MEFLDYLRKGAEFFGFGDKKKDKAPEKVGEGAKKPEEEGFVMRTLRSLGLGKKAEKVEADAKKERSGIFGEVWESVLARHFPRLSKLLDMASTVGLTRRDKEVFSLQDEFESITAFTMLVPDFLLRKITDPLVHSSIFMEIVEHWPTIGKGWFQDLKKANYDPDDVINVLRVMVQDLVTGKVSMDKVMGWAK